MGSISQSHLIILEFSFLFFFFFFWSTSLRSYGPDKWSCHVRFILSYKRKGFFLNIISHKHPVRFWEQYCAIPYPKISKQFSVHGSLLAYIRRFPLCTSRGRLVDLPHFCPAGLGNSSGQPLYTLYLTDQSLERAIGSPCHRPHSFQVMVLRFYLKYVNIIHSKHNESP